MNTYSVSNAVPSPSMPIHIAAAQQTPQIELEMSELQAALDALLDTLATLAIRLEPVLRPYEKAPEESEKTSASLSISLVAQDIRKKRFQIYQARQSCLSLMERLEV